MTNPNRVAEPVTERRLRGLLIEARNLMWPSVLRARIDAALKATIPQPNPPTEATDDD